MASYTEKEREGLITTICRKIATGRSLRSVLKDKDMPCRQSFHDWIEEKPERIDQYVCAREDRADSIFEDMLDIVDSQEKDVIILEDGKEVTNHDVIQRARLRVDTRKWMIGKMQPKKYGDKLELENKHSGEIKTTENIDLSNLTKEEKHQLGTLRLKAKGL
jgi:hypothetical protein